jgi:hypothetical protein
VDEASARRQWLSWWCIELEPDSWLFSAPDIVEAHFEEAGLADKLRDAVRQAGEPELINHGPDTHPKARLRESTGDYKETSDGPTLLEKMGLATIRAACPHFNGWLSRLETLSGKAV